MGFILFILSEKKYATPLSPTSAPDWDFEIFLGVILG